ncbi:hypothetical protein H072_4679 [Dactylellina haptotyla CBS 200.50]|uniref:Uncharacterized protein n=1 Tax=Dactylellina haptotyla (strain CBS 200.50) TaxID=1284197 RepID=S8AJX0_DACHA|nr:hypothetical protein H072_4679 [Dactylellina haptotyla CBS 200.50]
MEYEWIIPVAIFKAIAHYPFYHTLKRLTVECIVIHHFSQQYTTPMFVYNHLSNDSKDFIHAAGGKSRFWVNSLERVNFSADDYIPLPSALEEATTTFISDCSERLNLYFHEVDLYEGRTAPWLFFLHSQNTLRKLKINTTSLLNIKWGLNVESIIPDDSKLTMPNVRELWLISNTEAINYRTIYYVVKTFPKTQHLRIDAPSYIVDPYFSNVEPYDGISISLSDLRTAILPCPLANTWQPMTPKELRRIVARWHLIGRLRKLEWIAYVSGFEPADDCWYLYSGKTPKGDDMFVTKVITAGEGGGRENYRVWTQAGNRVGKFNNFERSETL